jgi:hypothetical protein
VSQPLDAVLALAADGTDLTCTLSPNSVQVIFYALSFLESRDAWREDYFDSVSDVEWLQIVDLLGDVAQEILP